MTTNQLNWQKDHFENIEAAWEGDSWDRRRLGEQLTNYVDRLQCGAVLALDARWGEGKTWFVRHWAKHLTDSEHNVIYLDAFANDYLDDPFLTIAAEISQAFKDSDEIHESDIEKLNAKTASVLISLAAVIPMIAAKAGMHWIGLGGAGDTFKEVYEQGKEVFDVASDEIASKVKQQIEKKIENHHIEKETIQDFKKELAELAEKLDKPLIFIIDELDRCRPDFAIRLIERIKHFFNIPKIAFILVMDKTQFSKVVCYNYGYDQNDSEEYLTKFIDFTIKLNLPKKNNRLDFIRQKLSDVGIPNNGQQFGRIDDLLTFMSEYTNTSTRKLIKIINELSLLALNSPTRNHILTIYLFLKNELIYKKTSAEIFEYIVQWFVEIVKSDSELQDLYDDLLESSNRNGRAYTTNQIYGDTLKQKKDISIQIVFVRYYDRFLKDKSSDYIFSEGGIMPFDSYDDLNFKKEWENYISTGLSA